MVAAIIISYNGEKWISNSMKSIYEQREFLKEIFEK